MGKVEEFFDRARWQDFLSGKMGSPFSQEDVQWAKWMGIDLVKIQTGDCTPGTK